MYKTKARIKAAYAVLRALYSLLILVSIINIKKIPAQVPIQRNGNGGVSTSIEKGYFIISIWIIYTAVILIDQVTNKKDYYDKTSNISIISVLSIFFIGFSYILLKMI